MQILTRGSDKKDCYNRYKAKVDGCYKDLGVTLVIAAAFATAGLMGNWNRCLTNSRCR